MFSKECDMIGTSIGRIVTQRGSWAVWKPSTLACRLWTSMVGMWDLSAALSLLHNVGWNDEWCRRQLRRP